MPKITSRRQQAANRRNAQLSTGPTTDQGKAAVSRNAFKHGLLARDIVVSDPALAESREEFDALHAALYDELRPQGFVEQTLVERIATCYWRLRRAQRFEVGALRETLEAPDPDAAGLAALRSMLTADEAALALEHRLLELFDKPADRLTADEAREIEQTLDEFANQWKYRLLDLDRLSFKNKLHQLLPAQILETRVKVRKLRAELKSAQHDEELRQTRRSLTASLPEGGALLRVVRYETMLDRQIHRAFAELRRIRDARRRDSAEKNTFQTKPSENDTL